MSACKAEAGDDAGGAHAESAPTNGMSEVETGESDKGQQRGGGVGSRSLGGATTVALPKYKLRLTVSIWKGPHLMIKFESDSKNFMICLFVPL